MDRIRSEEKILNTESAPFVHMKHNFDQPALIDPFVIDLEGQKKNQSNPIKPKDVELTVITGKDQLNIPQEPKKPTDIAVDYDEHKLSTKEVAERYGTLIDNNNALNSQGLTSAKVDELRLIHGFNTMKPVKGEHPVVVYLRKLVELFHILLIIGTFCFVLYAIFPNDEAVIFRSIWEQFCFSSLFSTLIWTFIRNIKVPKFSNHL
jgi:magnesium-transporting ATPase (P-type)